MVCSAERIEGYADCLRGEFPLRRSPVTIDQLEKLYCDYIACLNSRDLSGLGRYVDASATHNDRPIGLSGYRAMLEQDFANIPDLKFDIELLVVNPPYVASRLRFHCTPRAMFMNLDVRGVKVSFAENVFYEFGGEKIARVWSVIDKAAIEAQLNDHRGEK